MAGSVRGQSRSTAAGTGQRGALAGCALAGILLLLVSRPVSRPASSRLHTSHALPLRSPAAQLLKPPHAEGDATTTTTSTPATTTTTTTTTTSTSAINPSHAITTTAAKDIVVPWTLNETGAQAHALSLGVAESAADCHIAGGLAEEHPAIAQLCPLVSAATWAELTVFFAAGQPAPLRVHVVNLEAPKSILNTPCEKRFNEGLRTHGNHLAYQVKFSAELLLPEAVRRSRYNTPDPAEADVFLVEACIGGRDKQGAYAAEVVPILERSDVYRPLWRRHGGRDFAVVLTNDHGPCQNFNEHRQTDPKRWVAPLLRESIMLMNEGSALHGCYSAAKDIVIPTTAHVGRPQLADGCPLAPPGEPRKHFLFFSGRLSSRVRVRFAEAFADHPDVFVPERLANSEYLCEMRRSTFCLAPRGQAAWSPRLDEAVAANCIPVLLADFYDPPFSAVLRYEDLAVRVPEAQLEETLSILHNVSAARVAQLQANLGRARPTFRYAGLDEPLAGDNSLDLTMFLLHRTWQRRRAPRSRMPDLRVGEPRGLDTVLC